MCSSWTVTMISISLAIFFVFCDLCYCIPLPNDRNKYYINSKLSMDENLEHIPNHKCFVDDDGSSPFYTVLGIKYRPKRFVTDNSKWPTTKLYWKVVNYSGKLSQEEVDSTFDAAFKLWESYTTLRFVQAADERKSHIRISFLQGQHGDAFSFDGPGGELAHAFYPNKGGQIHVDDAEPWAPPTSFGRDLFPVAAHEIGHALGLRHSNVKEALMYPEYKGKNEIVALDQDDIAGIQVIYGSALQEKYPTENKHDMESNNYALEQKMDKKHHLENDNRVQIENKSSISTSGVTITSSSTMARYESSTATTDVSSTSATSSTTTSEFTTSTTAATTYTSESTSTTTMSEYSTKTTSQIPTIATTSPTKISETLSKKPVYHSFVITEDICNDPKLDAVVVLANGTAYSFKGNLYWRLSSNGVESGYPRNIEDDWGIPGHLDAAYTDINGDSYFFKGDKYWVLTSNGHIADEYPKSIAQEFVQTPNNLDAVIQWDKKLYFFKGKRYWPYIDENTLQDWPRDIVEISPVLINKIDAAGTFIDGNTYLFSGHQFFKIEQINNEMRIANGYPKMTGPSFFGCKS